MKAVKVITFGEILLRLSPQLSEHTAAIYVGGAEANVAAALAQWGTPVSYLSKVPENGLSRDVLAQLTALGIETDRMLWGGDRIGIYYLAQGSDLKHAEVVYDRKYSSFSAIEPGSVNWDGLLGDAEWFHWSAITPALNPTAAAICLEVLKAATRKGLTISTDLNFRSKLWQYHKKPYEVMPDLVEYCDVIMGNIWAAHTMLDTSLNHAALELDKREIYLEQATHVAQQITERYKRCKRVAFTFRFSNAPTHAHYYAFYYNEGKVSVSKTYDTDQVVDRVGSGDCFMAGLIHGQLAGKDDQGIISFAAAAAYSKFFVKGDFNTTSVDDIYKLM
ncbi:MAG: sugar kinase [Chitinophaga sp.]|uniref:sugar kinase n=1 Tax=Chitinophaga sp. TaxID=1869181 RepID=UPI0025B83A2A|nr:sugar kinase [Chitinophaga sp.]MBV8255622.1 sugar kinase [Chitinophaga sp.]